MAHNIHHNSKTGKDSFFSVQEKAWHGLGQIVQEYPTSEEAMRFAGLDYTVEKRPLFTVDSGSLNQDGETEYNEVKVPDHFATVRTDTDTVLGVVGKDYHVVQNIEAFSFFDAIVGGGDGVLYETAGALGNGERIFITAKMPDYIRVGKDDVIDKYVFLTTSHDGSGSIMAAFTPIRIVCNNTLNIALRNNSNMVKIRHTLSAGDRLREAHKIMGMVNTLTPMLEDIYNHWATVRITDSQVQQLIRQAMCPNSEVYNKLVHGGFDDTSTAFKNMCNGAFEYAMTSDTQQLSTTKGTVFGAFNAVTGYFQNVRNYADDTAKMDNLIFGGTAQRKSQVAFDLCNAFAKDGAACLLMN